MEGQAAAGGVIEDVFIRRCFAHLCEGAAVQQCRRRAVSDDGVEKLLVTARTRTSRNDIKIREIKTVTGIISLLQGLGFSHADIPLEEGKRTVHKLSSEEIAARRP